LKEENTSLQDEVDYLEVEVSDQETALANAQIGSSEASSGLSDKQDTKKIAHRSLKRMIQMKYTPVHCSCCQEIVRLNDNVTLD